MIMKKWNSRHILHGLIMSFICGLVVSELMDPLDTVLPRGDHLYQLVRSFTDYHLFFRTSDHLNQLTCGPKDYLNRTETLISHYLDMSSSRNFVLRELSRSQITWRTKGDEEDSDNKDIDKAINTTTSVKNKTEEKIHKYLVFVMVLPNHPFSRKVYRSISMVAPMFPFITIVMGNAYEFKDMCTKYFIHSYPKIMLFKSGLYVGNYEEIYTPEDIAGQFAKWTKCLPKSYPVYKPKNTMPKSILRGKYNSKTNISTVQTLIQDNLGINVSQLQEYFPSPNMEPFLGSVDSYVEWDALAFVISGIYVIFRLISTICTISTII